jgi:pyruvate formate lyase activating enzyme
MKTEAHLKVGGLTPLSTADWPGMLAAVVFCQGCAWRCRYCHNPELIPTRGDHAIPWGSILDFLERRRGLLDGLVFSGGEPTMQRQLEKAMRQVRERGFKIGLHTAGIYPDRLERILPLLDWVGLDIKAPYVAYSRITGVPASAERARKSLNLILASGIDHEIRTTVHPALLTDEEVSSIQDELSALGVNRHVMQPFRAMGCIDKGLLIHTR